VSDLGSLEDWVIEKKWDGIRGQIIKRNGEVFIWSRGEELMTEKIPELHFLKNVEKDFVIDGEIICHDGKEVMPFANLQTRIGRKNLTKKALETSPIAFITYDLLELNGADLRETSLEKRRLELSLLTSEINSEKLILSEEINANSWSEIIEIRSTSRQLKCEGLMLKRRSSAYKVGRKKGDWWKWKLDAMTIDAVMIYAMKGHGRRANLYTDFTFAIWHEGNLLPFTKAYSGLTDAEMKEVDAFVKKNTIDKFGPVRSVIPTLVFEIAFEGIQLSSRHKSGIALRFPRIHRWRKDKLANEANTKEDLLALLNQINPS
jgi:DNA ligase-1